VARPPLPIGTAGEIYTNATAAGFRARCNFRDFDGVTREIERHGKTEAKAKTKLREAIRDRSYADAAASITPDTLVRDLAEMWWTEFSAEDRSPNTLRLYRGRLDNQVLKALGALRIREVTTSRCDRLYKAVVKENGASVAKIVRTVVGGMLGMAARHDALTINPSREAGRISTKTKRPSRALTLDEAVDLRAKIAADPVALKRDLPDLTDLLLATGLRIAEGIAICRDAVDLGEGTVEVRGNVVREAGRGLYIRWIPKTPAGFRRLELPWWAVDMLRRRCEGLAGDAPVFTAPLGGLRDPSNTSADLREAWDTAGYQWVTSHVYRRTVATWMDKSGLSARAAADQLGHVRVSLVQDSYFGRQTRATGARAVMEVVSGQSVKAG